MKKAGFISLLLVLILLSGCATMQGGFGSFSNLFGGSSQEVGGRGVLLKFIEAPENNEEILEGSTFNIKLQLENYIPGERGLTGEICLRDELSDSFGGIRNNECRPINVNAATKIQNKVTPGIDEYLFGPYSYTRIPEAFSMGTKIFADIKYEAESTATAMACIKRPAAQDSNIPANCGKKQSLQVQQEDLPLKISSITSRTSSLTESDSSLELEIVISKATKGQLLTRGNVIGSVAPSVAETDFQVFVNRLPATCNNIINGRLQFRQNEEQKLIKCTSRSSLSQDYLQAPITIKMGYGFIQSVNGPTIQLIKREA